MADQGGDGGKGEGYGAGFSRSSSGPGIDGKGLGGKDGAAGATAALLAKTQAQFEELLELFKFVAAQGRRRDEEDKKRDEVWEARWARMEQSLGERGTPVKGRPSGAGGARQDADGVRRRVDADTRAHADGVNIISRASGWIDDMTSKAGSRQIATADTSYSRPVQPLVPSAPSMHGNLLNGMAERANGHVAIAPLLPKEKEGLELLPLLASPSWMETSVSASMSATKSLDLSRAHHSLPLQGNVLALRASDVNDVIAIDSAGRSAGAGGQAGRTRSGDVTVPSELGSRRRAQSSLRTASTPKSYRQARFSREGGGEDVEAQRTRFDAAKSRDRVLQSMHRVSSERAHVRDKFAGEEPRAQSRERFSRRPRADGANARRLEERGRSVVSRRVNIGFGRALDSASRSPGGQRPVSRRGAVEVLAGTASPLMDRSKSIGQSPDRL